MERNIKRLQKLIGYLPLYMAYLSMLYEEQLQRELNLEDFFLQFETVFGSVINFQEQRDVKSRLQRGLVDLKYVDDKVLGIKRLVEDMRGHARDIRYVDVDFDDQVRHIRYVINEAQLLVDDLSGLIIVIRQFFDELLVGRRYRELDLIALSGELNQSLGEDQTQQMRKAIMGSLENRAMFQAHARHTQS